MKITGKKLLVFCLLLAAIVPLEVWAKRAVPQPVKPIFFGSYKIHATGSGSSGNVIVSKKCKCPPKIFTIYEINYLKSLEKDVQNLHITKLEFSKNLLLIKTENDGIFSCDITNGKVKMIKTPQGYRILKSDKTPVQLEKIWIKTKKTPVVCLEELKMKIFDVIKIGFICCAVVICACGCKVSQQEYRGYEVGEIRQTGVDSYVCFGYATFIWQNPRDWQDIGELYSFPAKIFDRDKENLTLLKNKGFIEMERDFRNHSGGMIYFIPKGTIYKIDKIYTLYPSEGDLTYIEVRFTNGPLKDKKAVLTWAYPNSARLYAPPRKKSHSEAQKNVSDTYGVFPGMPTPLQLALGPWGLFNPKGTTVYGLSLNLTQNQLENCYGISISPLMNANTNQYGVSAGLINANQNTHGLSVGQCNAFEVNYGVSVGVFNLQIPKFEKGNKPKMNFLQIGLFNFADSGCQIGLLNCNETAKFRILPFFNFSPFPENSGTDKK